MAGVRFTARPHMLSCMVICQVIAALAAAIGPDPMPMEHAAFALQLQRAWRRHGAHTARRDFFFFLSIYGVPPDACHGGLVFFR